ncbi:hypothetical protein GCM10009039_23010 [Halocalculus aciditolerans]|uniref:Uncharacterized protein n=1 Tax=Halocalculus aciditolerans TaxID=1383812 RepID=A0A830FDJ2_9EURY|nr:hypothetical protein GCM10009039_23010 [Halocalculus aciditolerans]
MTTTQTPTDTPVTTTSTSAITQNNESVPPAEVNISNVTVESGGSTVLVVHARNIGELHLNSSNHDGIVFEYENATFTPAATSAVATYPPYWVWNPVQPTVTIRLPVHTTGNTSVGKYQFSANAWNTTNHTHENGDADTFVIHVKSTT